MTEPPPLPGSSDQRSETGVTARPTVGQKRPKPNHFFERDQIDQHQMKVLKECKIEPLWYMYLAKKAAKLHAEKEAMEAKMAWSAACIKYQDICCRDN